MSFLHNHNYHIHLLHKNNTITYVQETLVLWTFILFTLEKLQKLNNNIVIAYELKPP